MSRFDEELESQRWNTDPEKHQVETAYITPENIYNWAYVGLELIQGFKIGLLEYRGKVGWGIDWESKEQKEVDYGIFLEVTNIVISTLRLDDKTFSKQVLPKIYRLLERTSIFMALTDKKSPTQGNSIIHHIKKVPEVLDTSSCETSDKFILRISAIFHDFGKAFNIGSDQLHFHALISSDLFKRFADAKESELVDHLLTVEQKHNGTNDRERLKAKFRQSVDQASEIIRLHHVLEQIDKKRLTIETVANIFRLNEVNPLLLGLFVIADGGSVIPDKEEMYTTFLVDNLNYLARVMDEINRIDALDVVASKEEVESIKYMFVQAVQSLIRILSESGKELADLIKKIIKEISDRLDTFLAVSLLNLELSTELA